MPVDKPHYYDGKLYGTLFDPILREVREAIVKQVKTSSTVIDLGCGTGALVFEIAEKCKSVVGFELSSAMIKHAQYLQRLNKKNNVSFIHGDATKCSFKNKQFDYAIISMALHEMQPELRIKVLQEAKRIAQQVIIADYAVPPPLNVPGIMLRIIEFLAGIDHFRGFLHYQRNNGINQLLIDAKLSLKREIIVKKGTIKVVVVK